MKHTLHINKLMHILLSGAGESRSLQSIIALWPIRTLLSVLRFICVALMSSFRERILKLDPVSAYQLLHKKPAQLTYTEMLPTFKSVCRAALTLPADVKLGCISQTYIELAGALCYYILRDTNVA